MVNACLGTHFIAFAFSFSVLFCSVCNQSKLSGNCGGSSIFKWAITWDMIRIAGLHFWGGSAVQIPRYFEEANTHWVRCFITHCKVSSAAGLACVKLSSAVVCSLQYPEFSELLCAAHFDPGLAAFWRSP